MNTLKTTDKEHFLLFDCGPSEETIIIFSTKQNLQLLLKSKNWYADGTFKTVPQIFVQMYTIHCVHLNNVIPAVYALLPNKTQQTYTEMFQALKSLQDGLNPTSIMVDFEKSAVNAIHQEFGETKVQGCFFHFTQSFWKHIQRCGQQQRYVTDADFALNIKSLVAITFFPEDAVTSAYIFFLQE